MVILTQATTNPTISSTETTFAGLFILLFVLVIGGGGVAAWFIITNAMKFFENYRKSDTKRSDAMQKQLEKSAQFFSGISASQERITEVLERLETSIALQADRVRDIDNKVLIVDKMLETYTGNTNDNLKKVTQKVENVDDKVDKLNERVTSLSKDVEMLVGTSVTIKQIGRNDTTLWQRQN